MIHVLISILVGILMGVSLNFRFQEAFAFQNSSVQILKFKDLWIWLKENEVSILQMKETQKRAQLARSAIYSEMGPRFYFHSESVFSEFHTQPAMAGGLGMEWKIFDAGYRFDRLKVSTLDLEMAALQLERTVNAVAYQFLDHISGLIVSTVLLESSESRFSVLNKQYEITRQRYHHGLEAATNYQRLYSEFRRADLSRKRQTLDRDQKVIDFIRFFGSKVPFHSLENIKLPAMEDLLGFFDKEYFLDAEKTLAVRKARKSLKRAEVAVRGERRRFWPEVRLEGASEFYKFRNQRVRAQSEWQPHWQVGLRLQWTLWDWTKRYHKYNQAVSHLTDYKLALEQERIDRAALLESLEREERFLKESLALAREMLNLEERTFIQTQEQYREGRTSFLDLISTLDRRTQAANQEILEMQRWLALQTEKLKQGGLLYETLLRSLADDE